MFLLGKVLKKIFVLSLEFFPWNSPELLLQDPFPDAQLHVHDVKVFYLTFTVALTLLWGLTQYPRLVGFFGQNSKTFKCACA